MKKSILFFYCLLMTACAPTSKAKYMTQFGEFIEEVSISYKTYDESEWKKKYNKYQKFTNEWYNRFENELTLKDEMKIVSYKARWAIYYNLDGVSSIAKDILENEEVSLTKKASVE